MERRSFLAGMAGASLASLVPNRGMAAGILPATTGMLDAIRGVDAHCHIFNASDLPITSFVVEVLLKQDPDSPLKKLGHRALRILQKRAPNAREEMKWLASRSNWATFTGSASLMRDAQTMQATEVAVDDSDTRFRDAWMEIAEEDPESFNAFFGDYAETQAKSALLSQDVAREWLTSPNLAQMVRSNPDAVNFLVTQELSIPGKVRAYLAFLKTFLRYRYENALTLSALHGQASGRRIGLFTPAMVDFDLWIGSEECSETVPSSISDQVALAARIATHSDQKIRCLAPFNPLRAIVDPDYFPLMEKAAGEFGCLGFKVYPPMGFAPYGNPDGLVRNLSCKKGITGAMVDAAMERFFALCARERIPILAHGSPTNAPGGNPVKALLGGPNYWEQAFKKFPTYFKGSDPAVKVCIGHFGGISTKGHSHGWAGRLAELMKEHECLYVDTSYFEGLLAGGNAANDLMARLRQAMGSAIVLERTMYGSDWSMLAQEVGADSYPTTIEKALDGLGLKEPAKDAIFYRNAYRFYGLQPSGKGRERFLRN